MSDPLKDELAKPQYATMTDQQAADAINAMRVTVRRPVPTWRVLQTAIEIGAWTALIAAKDSTDPTTKGLAISITSWIDHQDTMIVDMDRSSVVAMLNGLQAVGVVTASQVTTFRALADTEITWAESVGLPEIGIGLVHNARI